MPADPIGGLPLRPLHFRSASELLRSLRAGELRSAELLEHLVDRIGRVDERVGAVVARDFERARAGARAADETLERGGAIGPLHGLPMTVKDSLETEGLTTTSGAPALAGHVPERDATAVRRLRDAGALLLGKTNVPLFAGDCQSYNAVYGTTRNPWDPERTPGGSSGGAAAALAAGLAPLELGSDIGGSIRIPAHFCGVFGHKPTWGLVPLRGHIPGPPGSLAPADLAVLGPLARSAEDLALALGVVAGPETDGREGWRLELPPPRATRPAELRVAAWLDDPFSPVDAACRERLEACADALEKAGARVERRARPELDFADAYATYAGLLHAVIGAGLPARVLERLAETAAGLAEDDASQSALQARGATLSHRQWLALDEHRHRLMAAWARFFREIDVALLPVSVGTAFPHDHEPDFHRRTLRVNGAERPYLDFLHWVGLVSVGGLPATVAPVGRTSDGLPVGVQIVGARYEDRTTLEVARRIEELLGGFEPPPGF